MIININPEFGIELALAVPYCYHLHTQGKLDTVITSKGMQPFYYFCNDVVESHTHRTIDNAAAGLNTLPNNWIHHNAPAAIGKPYDNLTPDEEAKANGTLDYTEWKLPDYKSIYKPTQPYITPTVFVTNVYNHIDKRDDRHYHHFTIKGLYDMFVELTAKGYDIIYKRENNQSSEITFDQNEQMHNFDITATVDGIGTLTDYQLCNYFDNVTNFNDIDNSDSYNLKQLKIMAGCDKFISVCGGNSILSSCFGGDVIIYVTQGRELRPGYFDENSYFRKLSGANIIPIFNTVAEIKEKGEHDYSEILTSIQNYF